MRNMNRSETVEDNKERQRRRNTEMRREERGGSGGSGRSGEYECTVEKSIEICNDNKKRN